MTNKTRRVTTAMGGLVAALALAACDAVYVGASYSTYPYDDAFYWNHYYCCDADIDIDIDAPDRPDGPDRPERPDVRPQPLPAPVPPVTARPSRPPSAARPPSVSRPINRPSVGGGRFR